MIKINLLAEAKPAKKKRGVAALGGAGRLNVLLLSGAVVAGLVVVGVQWWVEASRLREQEEKNRVAQQEVTRLDAVLKEVKEFEDKKAKLQKKVELINQLKQNQRGPVRLMDEVSNALPDLLWLERMEYNGSQISLEGKALNPPAVANFLENLRRVPSFQEPKVESILAVSGPGSGSNLYRFRLSFVFTNLDRTQFDPSVQADSGAARDAGAKSPDATGSGTPASGAPAN